MTKHIVTAHMLIAATVLLYLMSVFIAWDWGWMAAGTEGAKAGRGALLFFWASSCAAIIAPRVIE